MLVHDLFTYLENDSQFPRGTDICFYAYLCMKETSLRGRLAQLRLLILRQNQGSFVKWCFLGEMILN
jgi:hypothetical protein